MVKRLSFVVLFFPVLLFGQKKLTYEEYRLPVTVDTSEREPLRAMCEFVGQRDSSIYKKRQSWRQRNYNDDWSLDTYNKKLKTIGFSITISELTCRRQYPFDLWKGDSLYVSGLSRFSFFFNDTTHQFIILTSVENQNKPPNFNDIIITNNVVKTNPYSYYHSYFYKNGILLLSDEYRKQSVLFWDIHNDKDTVLCEYEIKFEHPEFIQKNLILKNTDWIFECEEKVFINGKDIGKEKGYSKIFDYSYIDDNPFYFYEKNSLIYISYNNKSLPHKYKKVLHYLCCGPSMLNPASYNKMVCFYAQKEDGNWYYVEIGLYK